MKRINILIGVLMLSVLMVLPVYAGSFELNASSVTLNVGDSIDIDTTSSNSAT